MCEAGEKKTMSVRLSPSFPLGVVWMDVCMYVWLLICRVAPLLFETPDYIIALFETWNAKTTRSISIVGLGRLRSNEATI